jgi:hypothetical protein
MNSCEDRTLKIKVFGILGEKLKSNTLSITISDNSILLEELAKCLEELYPYLSMNEINLFSLAVKPHVLQADVNTAIDHTHISVEAL